MPRKRRLDEPGLLHHVCNRGIARRPVFETARDVAVFCDLLREAVEDDLVEILAFSVLTTHYHLLVRSHNGQLSRAMQQVAKSYVQHFNRTRGRDGPLFRDRFFSRPIRSDIGFRLIVRYIDENAVVAGLTTRATAYPHSSAWWYARASGPDWLSRASIEREVCGDEGAGYRPEHYADHFGWTLSAAQRELVERRMHARSTETDSLDHLVLAALPHVRSWLEANAQLADGVKLTEVLLSPATVLAVCDEHRQRDASEWLVPCTRKRRPGWALVRAGLLRMACGLEVHEIGRHLGTTKAIAWRLVCEHGALLRRDSSYSERASEVLHAALARELTPVVNPRRLTPTP